MLITRYFVSCCYEMFCVVARHFVNIGTHNIINHLHTCKVVKVFGHNMAYVLRRLIDCIVHINVTLWLESIKFFYILKFSILIYVTITCVGKKTTSVGELPRFD